MYNVYALYAYMYNVYRYNVHGYIQYYIVIAEYWVMGICIYKLSRKNYRPL